MKYALEVNDCPTDGHFADEEQLKAYLIKWKWASDEAFVIQTVDGEVQTVSVDELVDILKERDVVCETPCMCEMGDDHVELRLIKL